MARYEFRRFLDPSSGFPKLIKGDDDEVTTLLHLMAVCTLHNIYICIRTRTYMCNEIH